MTVFRPGPTLFIAVLLTSINAFFSMIYLYSGDWLNRANSLLDQYWADRPDCLYSWANASLEYSEALTVISAQSLVFSVGIAAVVFISAIVFREISHDMPGKFGPGSSLLFGLCLAWVWLCLLGRSEPISSLDELGSLSRRFFNSGAGVLLVLVFLNLLSYQLGEDAAKIVLRKVGREAGKNDNVRRRRDSK